MEQAVEPMDIDVSHCNIYLLITHPQVFMYTVQTVYSLPLH